MSLTNSFRFIAFTAPFLIVGILASWASAGQLLQSGATNYKAHPILITLPILGLRWPTSDSSA
jgi:hypothetical protein